MKQVALSMVVLLVAQMGFAAGPWPVQTAPSQITAWLYRPDSDNSDLLLTLYMDGRKLANLGKGQFFGVQVPLGLHAFSWTNRQGTEQVVIPIGPEQAYWQVNFRTGQPFLVISPVSAQKAVSEMSGLRPVDANGVFDSHVMVMAPNNLPAQPLAAGPSVAPSTVSSAPLITGPSTANAAIPILPIRQIPPVTTESLVNRPSRTPVRERQENNDGALNSPRLFEVLLAPYSYSMWQGAHLYGAEIELAMKVTDHFSLISDVGNDRSRDNVVTTVSGIPLSRGNFEMWTYRFGPKVSIRPTDRITTFGHSTAGGTRIDAAYNFGPGITANAIGNGLSVAGGGGIDFAVKKSLGLRLVDSEYVYNRVDASNSHGLRISAGLVFRIE